MSDNPAESYKIGYRRPPFDSRFKNGVSGNPRGRKPGTRNLATLLAAELDVSIAVSENGKRKKRAKREVIIAQLVNKASAADLRAMQLLFSLIDKTEARKLTEAVDEAATDETLAESDARVLSGLRQRLSQDG